MNKTTKWTGVANRDPLPLRKLPDAKSDQILAIPKGTKISVCDTVSGWLYAKVDDKYGYVSTKYVKYSAPSRTISKTVKWVGKTTEAVTARSWAATYAPKSYSLSKGARVQVCDTVDGYYYVKVNDTYGYVPHGKVNYVSEPISAKTFLASVKKTQEYARTHGYIYADSQSKIPTADKKISCDRLVAKSLWDLGFTDQPKGGIAFRMDIDKWFTSHGFKKSTSLSAAKAGSILIVMNPSGSSRHMFVVASRNGDCFTRYDCGCLDWIRSKQPLQGLWMSRLIAVYNIA